MGSLWVPLKNKLKLKNPFHFHFNDKYKLQAKILLP